MYYQKIIIVFMICTYVINASGTITPEQGRCYQEFNDNSLLRRQAFKKLSEKDRDTLIKNMRYDQHPDDVKTALHALADNFYQEAQQAQIPITCSKNTLYEALLIMKIAMQRRQVQKPTDETTTRMYVFTTQLSPEQQASVCKKNYLENPEATRQVMVEYGKLVAQQLAKLGLISETQIEKKAQAITNAKMEELEALYKEQKV